MTDHQKPLLREKIMSKRKKRTQKKQREPKKNTHSTGQTMQMPPASAAALSPGFFNDVTATKAVPTSWEDRARKAVEYYQEEPLVSNAINAWRTFALGDEIRLNCENETVRDEAKDAFITLGLNDFVKDMVLQLLLKGDAMAYLVRSKSGDDIERVICLNPISVTLNYENDALVEVIQRPIHPDGSYGEEVSLDLDFFFHAKWNAPEFEMRGQSMVLPAFESIELLRDYRTAERAIAKRWATPLRFIQVGGAYGSRIITPDKGMLDAVRDELNQMDLKSGLVVPFYVKAETYGAEGITLNTEAKVHEVKEDILTALGLARSVVTGQGPNFATASVSMQKMIVQLKEIKQAARDILDWVFDEWLELKGYENETLHYQFSDLDLSSEVDQKKLLIELYDRGLISKNSLQEKMNLNPEVEAKERDREEIVVDSNWSVEDISRLVALDVLTVDEARKRLGLDQPAEKAREKAALADAERIYAKHRGEDHV